MRAGTPRRFAELVLGGDVARVLRMPEVADDPTDALLTAWLVAESSGFAGAQSLATVETESLLVSVEVSEPGVLLKVLVEPGERVQAGRPLAVLGEPGEVVEDVERLLTRLGLAVTAPHQPDDPLIREGVPAHAALPHTTWPPHDVPENVPAATAPEEPAAVTPPQVQLRAQVRAEALQAVVDRVPDVSTLALLVKAVVISMRGVGALPWSSSSTDVAVQRWSGSEAVTTVVHVAGLMTTRQLTATLEQLEGRARGVGSDSEGTEPATVTVVDLESYGVAEGAVDATARRPAVLTVGAVTDQPVLENGVLVPGRVFTVALSCDADQVTVPLAARWLARLTELLEEPLRFLT